MTERDFEETRQSLIRKLLDQRSPGGYWEGELSTSALSVATSVAALYSVDAEENLPLIMGGLQWLAKNQNADGGWGDTTLSYSNISTTVLCWAALGLKPVTSHALDQTIERTEAWIRERTGTLDPDAVTKAIMARYGKDHTFSIPILTMLAICGRLGPHKEAWQRITPLPFELAAIPQRFYKWVSLPVVSYALPALIAIGQAIFYHRGSKNPLVKAIRKRARSRTLSILQEIQPDNGGFLEAIPLTSFVAMSLASIGLRDHPVVRRGIRFIRSLARLDGGWPIDTHLATWVTTLSINALSGEDKEVIGPEDKQDLLRWLCNQQYREVHPYTGADPGGWSWTPLPGGVPDGDDTSGALIALANLSPAVPADPMVEEAASAGVTWLVGLLNRDGGVPTFCRGWGTLPFDMSCADITAHALAALQVWQDRGLNRPEWNKARARMLKYLEREQRKDGSWNPLWFGNQDHQDEENPTYGTARVLIALSQVANGTNQAIRTRLLTIISRGCDWLLANQNEDGGWGGIKATPSSIEETSLALDALARCQEFLGETQETAIAEGSKRLIELTHGGKQLTPSPIGFYFANLWYYEQLYPLTFAVSAMASIRRHQPLEIRKAVAAQSQS